MYRLQQTERFAIWLKGLRDQRARARIIARLEAVRLGNMGDAKSLGGGISELRIHTGPGYRLYFTRRRGTVILLLCSGSKAGQSRDIAAARDMLERLESNT